MNYHPRNNTTNRFPIFKEVFGDISDAKILDFGGSSGNLLYFSNKEIKEELYTCTDIMTSALTKGIKEFPKANFIHYDRFNWMYNHNGNKDLVFPKLDNTYDYIWAYSVFSHTDLDEFCKTIKWMISLNPKKIAVSFLDNSSGLLEYFYNKRIDEYGHCINIKELTDFDMFSLIDNNLVISNTEKLEKHKCKHFITFYKLDFLKKYFINAGISINITKPKTADVPFIIIELDS